MHSGDENTEHGNISTTTLDECRVAYTGLAGGQPVSDNELVMKLGRQGED